MTDKIALGKAGENESIDYLIDKGYEIIEKNWNFGHKEIDIIGKKDNTIVFFEVKTRSTNVFHEPKEAVNYKKRQNLLFAAQAYINRNAIKEDVRFDIISIVRKNNKAIIEHIVNAFHPLTA
ncbi:MAG: YraN family protein [Bacteroidales bacterium]|nr:YraN family protein [Bacteroidales bacterium]